MADKAVGTAPARAGDEAPARRRLDGVVIGALIGLSERGEPLVIFPGNPLPEAVAARTTARLSADDVGREVALMFEDGNPRRPLVIGRIWRPDDDGAPSAEAGRLEVRVDDERLELTAEREIVLRCGRASITLTRAGKILLRGAYILSRSSGVNKIKGGSIQLN